MGGMGRRRFNLKVCDGWGAVGLVSGMPTLNQTFTTRWVPARDPTKHIEMPRK